MCVGCVCVCVCVCVCDMCVWGGCVCVWDVCVCVCVCVCVYSMYVHVWLCMYVHDSAPLCTYVCTCVTRCLRMYIHVVFVYFHINLQLCMQFPSFLGEHQLGWSGDWREICGFFPNVPFEIREQGGHSLKSSIKVRRYIHTSVTLHWRSYELLVGLQLVHTYTPASLCTEAHLLPYTYVRTFTHNVLGGWRLRPPAWVICCL